jgi:hypothetical protein
LIVMRRVLPACLLLICLVVLPALGGCLFGKKGGDEEGGEVAQVSAEPPGEAEEAAGPAEGPSKPGGEPPAPAPKPAAGAPPAEKPAPNPAEARKLLAQAKQAKASTDYDKGLSLAQEAAKLDPGNMDAQWLMAWMYAEKKQNDKAIAAFNAFIAGAGDDPRVADAKAAVERLGPGEASGPPAAGPKPPGPAPLSTGE